MTEAGSPDGCRILKAYLRLDLADKSSVSIVTEPSTWHVRQGPVTWDHLFHGETYNASRELPTWAISPLASFGEGEWTPAQTMSPPGPGLGSLQPTLTPPIRVVESFSAVSQRQINQSAW